MADRTFSYDIDRRVAPLLRVWGVRPDRDGVTLTADGQLRATFGWVRLSTPLANVAGAEQTGPYSLLKAVGVRLSLADRGATFGTGRGPGVCIRFTDPVRWYPPLPGRTGLTVTVRDPEGLVAALEGPTEPR